MTPEELFQACADPLNKEAHAEFSLRYDQLIRATLTKTRGSSAGIDDLRQNIALRLLKNGRRALLQFKSDKTNSDYAFIKRIARSEALDDIRKNSKPAESLDGAADSCTVPADAERAVLLREIEDFLSDITQNSPSGERDRRVFLLYYRTGLTAQEISRIPGIGLRVKGVESIIRKLTQSIRQILHSGKKSVTTEIARSREIGGRT